MARLSLSLLGPFQATLDGQPVTGFVSNKARALLAYLAVEQALSHPRSTLAGLLWPDWPERSALANLRTALANLRTAIGDRGVVQSHHDPFLLITRETLQLNPASDHWIDVMAFADLAQAGPSANEQLEEAIALYRGPFMDGFSVGDSAAYEGWISLNRERLQRQVLAAFQRLVQGYEGQSKYGQACETAWRWVELAPWQESAHQALMRLLALSGQRGAALAQYEACCRALREELDVKPGEETQRLYERIRSGELGRAHVDRDQVPGSSTQPPLHDRIPSSDLARPHVEPELAPPAPPATIRQRPALLKGQRRIVTALLANVKGSTALAEQIDTEDWVEIMDRVFQILGVEIYRYGGEIDQFRGDGLVAFFGLPPAHEDDPERALLAALAMQDSIGEYAAELAGTDRPIELLLRVGVNTGEVVAATVGTRHHREETAMGRAIALAAIGENACEPGTVLVTENTYRLVQPLFEWRALGEMVVKGVSQSIAVYRPLAARVMPGKGRGIEGLESPLVGRNAEFGALREAIDRLRAGLGGIVTLVGEAGIGKSRLVTEVKDSIDLKSENLEWREGRCLSYATNVAHQLWLSLLHAVLDVAPDAPPAAVRNALRETVQALCPEQFEEVYPYLGRLLSVPLEAQEEAAARALAGESLKVITFRALETLVQAAARRRPLVIVCEDLHWADPTSLELLERLLSLTDHVQVLFLCVFRPETPQGEPGHGCWRIREIAARLYRHRHTDLWLDPLSDAESAELVGNLLRVEDLSLRLKERILSHAEGNPFYAEEILRSLIEGGGIAQDAGTGRWQATAELDEIAIPDTLHGVLMARIDRLPAEARRVLQLAAIIGRIFAFRVLAAIAQPFPPNSDPHPGEQQPAGRALDTHLVALQRAQMIRERARVPELEYIFKHHLTQEAAYSGLLRRERRAIHRQVAGALEGLYPERLEEQVELLAHHWQEAEEPQKAVPYLVRAGQRAAQRYANQEALSYFDAALQHVHPGREYDRILEERAQLYLNLFQGHEAADDYDRLLESAVSSGDQAAEIVALLGLGQAHNVIAFDEPGFAKSSLDFYRRAYALARQLGDKASMVRALVPTPHFLDFWPEYREEALANTQEALALSREIGDEELILDSLMVVCRTSPARWTEWEETLIQQLESRRDLPRLNTAYWRLQWLHLFWGNLRRCVECCDAGIHLAAEIGVLPVMYPTLKALALLYLGRYDAVPDSLALEVADAGHQLGGAFQRFGTGTYLLELMAYDDAAETFRDVIERASRIGRVWLSDWAWAQLARALVRAGPVDWTELAQIAHDLRSSSPLAMVHEYLGEPTTILSEIALAEGDLEQALRHAQAVCAKVQENRWRFSHLSALDLQLDALLRLDRPGDVVPLADTGIQMAEEMGRLPMLWRIRASKAQALATLGRAEASTSEYEAAAAILLQLAAAIPEAERQQSYLSSTPVSSILAASRGDSGWKEGSQ